jgi:hypothetical protein
MNLIEILTRYMTPFEARLCIAEMRRLGLIPWQWPVIEGEVEHGQHEDCASDTGFTISTRSDNAAN